MKILSSLCVAVVLLAACNENAGTTNEDAKSFDTAAKVQNADSTITAAPPLVMAGYSGILPCADCEALEVTLSLFSDSSYQKKSLYMGRKSKGAGSNEFTDTGKWVMKGDTLLLDLRNAPGKYIKSDSGLVQLDMKGRRITGKLANKYVLKQTH
jgi:uncharacterized lipoprotein NlpE involved in copper resistance